MSPHAAGPSPASARAALRNKFALCLGQWRQLLKSMSDQISAVADSLSLHIFMSVKKREARGSWVGGRWVEVTGRLLRSARESPAPPALAGMLPGRERLAYANAFMTCFVTKPISGLWERCALPGGRGRGSDGSVWDLTPAWCQPSNPRTQPGWIWNHCSPITTQETASWLQQEEKEGSVIIISFADENQQTEELLSWQMQRFGFSSVTSTAATNLQSRQGWNLATRFKTLKCADADRKRTKSYSKCRGTAAFLYFKDTRMYLEKEKLQCR